MPSKAKQDYVYCFYSPFHRRLSASEKDDLHCMWSDYAMKNAASDFLMEYDRTSDGRDVKAFDATINAEDAIHDRMREFFWSAKK